MKKLLLFMSAIALTATIAVAQDKKDYKQERTEWEKKVKNELKLTADQTTKYDALKHRVRQQNGCVGTGCELKHGCSKRKENGT
jgi:hypothetical protein